MPVNENINQLLITINGITFSIHQTIIIWFGVLIFVGALLIFAGKQFKNADPSKPPTKTIIVFEQLYGLCVAMIGDNLKGRTAKYLPLMGTLSIIMVICNLLGLIGLQPPTSNVSVNLTLALLIFFLIHGTNIKDFGIIGKLKAWCEPMVFLFPLNVIGDLALPISLTFRLFGNMLGGSILVAMIYMLIKTFLPFTGILLTVTPFLHMYFDIFTAFIQTYIFFTLSSFFLSEAIKLEDEK